MSFLSEFFGHPVVQSGVVPFFAAFFVVMVLHRLRLGGLALVAAFYIAVWLISGFALQPLTITRKIILISLITPLLGVLIDFMARGSMIWRVALALLAAAASIWVYWPVLAQKPMAEAVLYGGGAAVLLSWLVSATLTMHGAPVRSSAAALALAAGTSVCAGYVATLYGQYAMAIAAGAAAFLLWLMLTNRKWSAGAVLRLPAATLTGLLLCGVVLVAQLPWYAAAVLALIPLAARLPAPERAALWAQAVVVSLYTFAIVAAAIYTLSKPWRALPL
ncbi:MAG TPA: hypothetical protein VIQ28_07915 [Burkholderiales bacterium]